MVGKPVHPTDFPVLLFVDGHSTHIDQETNIFCREHGVIICWLPADASHIVQPRSVALF